MLKTIGNVFLPQNETHLTIDHVFNFIKNNSKIENLYKNEPTHK